MYVGAGSYKGVQYILYLFANYSIYNPLIKV